MPFGDPAGYLPSVKKSRRRRGEPEYQPKGAAIKKYVPRSRRRRIESRTGGTMGPKPMPRIDPGTGGAVGPRPMKRMPRVKSIDVKVRYRPRKRRKRDRD